MSSNGMRSPSRTVNSASVLKSSPRERHGGTKQQRVGPGNGDQIPPSMRRTHGTIEP